MKGTSRYNSTGSAQAPASAGAASHTVPTQGVKQLQYQHGSRLVDPIYFQVSALLSHSNFPACAGALLASTLFNGTLGSTAPK